MTDISRVIILTNMPSTYNVDLFDALSNSHDFSVHVVYLTPSTSGRSWSTHPDIDHPHSILRPRPQNTALYWSSGWGRLVTQFSPHIVVLCQYANLPMQMAAMHLRLHAIPYVLWLEPPGVKYSEAPALNSDIVRRLGRRWAIRAVGHTAREVWAISSRAAQEYAKILPRTPIHPVPYFGGIEPMLALAPTSLPKRFTRERPMRILYAGKMVERKGVDILIDALTPMLHSRLSLEVRLVGRGPMAHLAGDLARAYPRQVDCIDQVERQEMTAHYEWADVAVVPSRYDGWGMTAIESAAASCAVVSTDSTGAAVDGLGLAGSRLLATSTADSIREVLFALAGSPKTIESLRIAARTAATSLTAKKGAEVFAKRLHSSLELGASGLDP